MCLIARHLESAGLPTLIMGSGLDILQAGKPPRARFLNYPLGFEAGQPFNEENQLAVLAAAISGFDDMTEPGIEPVNFNWEQGWQMISDRDKHSAGSDLRSERDATPRYQTLRDKELAEGS
ncbi:MAG: hypothetical protein HOI43_02065 [Gammaproteobacteria bacterium]|nr:hypothetical protein [Gammaproteobacteria bacterium]